MNYRCGVCDRVLFKDDTNVMCFDKICPECYKEEEERLKRERITLVKMNPESLWGVPTINNTQSAWSLVKTVLDHRRKVEPEKIEKKKIEERICERCVQKFSTDDFYMGEPHCSECLCGWCVDTMVESGKDWECTAEVPHQ